MRDEAEGGIKVERSSPDERWLQQGCRLALRSRSAGRGSKPPRAASSRAEVVSVGGLRKDLWKSSQMGESDRGSTSIELEDRGGPLHAGHMCQCWRTRIFQDQLTIPELMIGKQQRQLVGCVDPAPVQTEPEDKLGDQV